MRKQSLAKRLALMMSVALALSLGVAGTAYAYYTDSTKAEGMMTFSYDPNPPTTEVDETVEGTNKIISVRNTGEVDAMVRVKVFDPHIPGLNVSYENTEGWNQAVNDNEEEWWYYTEPLAPKAATPAFKVIVTTEVGAKLPQSFDIVVVQQCTDARSFGTIDEEGHTVLGTFAAEKKYLTSQGGE